MGTDVWAVIDDELASHGDAERQLAWYRKRARMAPAVFLLPGRDVAMIESWAIESRDRIRVAVMRLRDDALPRAMAHPHPLVRRLAVSEKARRLRLGS